APLKDTPAYRAGIKAGDKIIKIDGTPSADFPPDKAIPLIKGKKGTQVKLTLAREGRDEPLEITVTRDVIKIPILDTERKQNGIFLIKLYNFSANSAYNFRVALREFISSGSNKLIIDLRGNPGGYLESSVDMASWFLPMGDVVAREKFANGEEVVYRSKGYDAFINLPLILLVDGGSASASEIFAGALRESGKAKLVGEKTFGKGSVQQLVNITPETSLKITVARWLTPNGVSISKDGLSPDYEVKFPKEKDKDKGEKEALDPQMDKAIELLSK
ncbi:MAG TPA: S41 family peptidase, partial [Candidatus Paceibacterota bacterium]